MKHLVRKSGFPFVLAAAAALLCCSASVAQVGTQVYTCTLSAGDYEIRTASDGTQEIRMEGFGQLLTPGKPKLPSKIFCLAVPPDASVRSVKVIGLDPVTLPGTYNIAPAPAPRPADEDPRTIAQIQEVYERNRAAVYGSDAPYPEAEGRLVSVGGYRQYGTVDVRYSPFRYNPVSGALRLYRKAKVIVMYEPDPERRRAAGRWRHEGKPELVQRARGIVDNFEEAQAWYATAEPASLSTESEPSIDYVIITTMPLTGRPLQPILNWQTAKGRSCFVATTMWIEANYGSADLQQSIRYFLMDKVAKWGIIDVLIVGTANTVPMRMMEAQVPSGFICPVPSDYYYAELTSGDDWSWDRDGDGKYGEQGQDQVDFTWEVTAGRIPSDDPDDVYSICRKFSRFECSTDMAFKKNALLACGFKDNRTDEAEVGDETISYALTPAGATCCRIYEDGPVEFTTHEHDVDLSNENVVNTWSGGHYAYALLSGHGNQDCTASYTGTLIFHKAHAPLLNDDYPAVVFANACDTAWPENPDSLGASLMAHGAIGFIGAARVSFYTPEWDELADGWPSTLACLIPKRLYADGQTLGQSLYNSLREMYTTYNWDDCWFHMFEWPLYGNPDMRIRDRPGGLGNMSPLMPSGWTYPIVPRSTGDAAYDWCPISASLPGNAAGTYYSYAWTLSGTHEVFGYDVSAYLDGQKLETISMGNFVPGEQGTRLNGGPVAVRGGRHTLYYAVDSDDIVGESDEADNSYGRQFVWGPLSLANDTPIERSAPPIKDAYGPVTVGTYYNNDGFSFDVQGVKSVGWWSAVGTLPVDAASDYDLKLWDAGSYTGSEGGFGPGELRYSSYDVDGSDFVLVNQRVAPAGTYYAGVINENGGSGKYRIEKAVSQPVRLRPGTQWNGPYSKSADNVLDLYEVYLDAGSYMFYLDQTAGGCDLGMSLHSAAGSFFRKNECVPGGMANSSGNGLDEAFEVTVSQSGHYCLAVWKVSSSDYGKTCTYRIACGPPTITVITPSGGESWTVGELKHFIWTSYSNTGPSVKIELSRDGGSSWSTITESAPSVAGYNWFEWTVAGPASAQCRARIISTSDSSYTDTSDADFAIKHLRIAGTVTDPVGTGVAGVTMTGLPGNPVTNASGAYSADIPYEWCGTVTPTKSGWALSPANRQYAYIDYDATNENWTATPWLTDSGVSLTGVDVASLAWGDYDSDGDLDLVVCGYRSGGPVTKLYANDGSGAFSEIATTLPNVSHGGVAWGDYDRDGDLDIALAGYSTGGVKTTRVFRNDGGGVFTDSGAALTGVWQGALAWGDLDNDGDLDLAIAGDTGAGYSCKVYRNDGGGAFTALAASFTGVFLCHLAWGDYDMDGDLDLVVAGNTGSSRVTQLYRNDGSEVFTPVSTTLPGVDAPGLAWGDYDQDGDLDLALCGNSGTRITKVYRNDGGTFVDIGAPMIGVNASSLAWGDCDNDGDLDLAVSGYYTGTNAGAFRLYRNDSGTFTDASPFIPGLQYCSLAWGDCDSDGDLDLALAGIETAGVYRAKVYRNNGNVFNTPPNAPSWPAATVSGDEITFRWLAGSDAQTPATALSYNLRVGTSPGASDVLSGMANASTGLRLLPALGNVQTRLTWTLRNIPPGTYYWSVQAIDASYAASPWAPTCTSGSVFTDSGIALTGVSDGAVAWGDYDNDNDLDLAVTGYTGAVGSTVLYRNSAGSFSNSGVSLQQLFYGSLAWGDYDNDGLLDLELSGYDGSARYSKLYRNTGSGLTDSGVALDGVNLSSSAWVDWDNDGDLDLSLAGATGTGRLTSVYRNNDNGTFSFSGIGFPFLSECALAWADYDNDGDLDVAMAGDTGGGFIAQVYRRNAGGTYSLAATLTGCYQCALAWGDYDNDGDLDLALAGNTGTGCVTKLYRNDAGSFIDTGAALQAVSSCALAWGDFDNDGDLDLALAGWTGAARTTRVYRNDGGGAFTDTGAALIGVSGCSLAWGDYDRDGDLDLALCGFSGSARITKIYRNQCLTPNTTPTAPTGLIESVGGTELTLSWNAASDSQTPAEGLTYNLRVGTSPGGSEVFCGMAHSPSGTRRIPAIGNAHKKLSWTLTGLPAEDYFWSVQAIDPSYAGSQWAVEQQAHIVAPTTVPGAKLIGDTKPTRCEGAVVTAAFPGCFYIEADDRSCGLRVEKAGHGLSAGMRANVYGIMRTNTDGERYLEATSAVQNGTGSVEPVGLHNVALGGCGWHYTEPGFPGQCGVTGGIGLNNLGLLVRTWGVVTHSEAGFFYLNDGSGANDGSGQAGVKVLGAVPVNPGEDPIGCLVEVTGISSCFRTPSEAVARRILTRGPEDVRRFIQP